MGGLLWRALEEREPASPPPDVLLISLDTLRRDRVGSYPPGRDTTPNLDAFAARGLRFDQAFAPYPWTLVAHATLLSGLYPSVHRINRDRALSEAVETLPEAFARAGYATFGMVDSCLWLDPQFGFTQGFDEYEVTPPGAAGKVDRLLARLEREDARPTFGFVHFFDAHSDTTQLPYEGRADLVEQYAGWYTGPFDGSLPEHPEWGAASELLEHMNKANAVLEGDELRYLGSLYDAGVRSLDAELGRLFAQLEASGALDNTIVMILADHGEELFEHGHALHNGQFDELVHIPLLLVAPGVEPGASEAFVSQVDLAPTLLELAGLAVPADMQGSSVAALARGASEAEPRDFVLLDNEEFLTLRSRTEAAISVPGGIQYHLVESDPQQLHNRIAEPDFAPRLKELMAWLERERAQMEPLWLRLGAQPGSVELSDEAQGALDKLGYTGD